MALHGPQPELDDVFALAALNDRDAFMADDNDSPTGVPRLYGAISRREGPESGQVEQDREKCESTGSGPGGDDWAPRERTLQTGLPATGEKVVCEAFHECGRGARSGGPQLRFELRVYGLAMAGVSHLSSIRIATRLSDAGIRVLLVSCLVLLVGAMPRQADARQLRLGFFDGGYVADNAQERAAALDQTNAVGGEIVRLNAAWLHLAPTKPRNPTDPDDPAYDWSSLDAAVSDAVASRLTPLVTVNAAPRWAEGPHRPSSAGMGTWRPGASAFREFTRAMARRYSGRTAGIPRVRYWQIWNEPNLATYLTPQYVRRNGRWRAASPGIFRSLINAGFAGLKSVDPHNFVVTAGTAPYGDLAPGGRRIAPVKFLRAVLARPTRFDAISHHPYGVGGPFTHALNADDVAVPDIVKLDRVLKHAEGERHALPRGRKELWVTEISWDSRPPDPDGVAEATQARWLAEALYVLWRQRVSTVTWFQVRDQAPDPSYAATNQSGVYFANGRPKLSARAFKLPLVARPRQRGVVPIWGMSHVPGVAHLQAYRAGRWRTIATVPVRADRPFTRNAPLQAGTRIRATVGSVTSLSWVVR